MQTRKLLMMTTALVLGAATVLSQTRTPSHLFQQAVDLMETKGDYAAAIRVFEELAKGSDRKLAARSLLHVGLCYEKLGKAEAQKAYQRLLREFADQREVVAEARVRLFKLAPPGSSSKGSVMLTRRLWAGPEVDLEGAPSPDGRYLSYVDWETGDLALRDLFTGEKRRLTHKGSWLDTPEYALYSTLSPDGKQAAYTWYDKDAGFELRVVGLDGSAPRVLYRNEEMEYVQPGGWSPDSKHLLALFTRKDRTHQIVIISVVDRSVRVLKTVDWRYPNRLSFSPDGLYVLYDFPPEENSPQRDIFVLSADGIRETHLINHPANDFSPVWLPDGKGILFASDRTGILDGWVIPVSDGKTQGSPVLVKPDIGRMVPMGFVRNGSFYHGLRIGTTDVYVAALDPATGKILEAPRPISERFVGSNLYPEWSPDGRYLAYLSRRGLGGGLLSTALLIRNFKTGEERELRHHLNYILPGMRWSPDGRYILATGGDKKAHQGLYRIDVQTGEVATIVHEPGIWIGRGVWSPDAQRVYYSAEERTTKGPRIVARDLETGREEVRYRGEFFPNVALSPDGRHFAFRDTTDRILMVMPAAGGVPHERLRVQESIMDIAWTPDGRYLTFAKRPTASRGPQEAITELWRVLAEGGEPQNLGLKMSLVPQMRWHPDGRHVAFTAGEDKNEVWVIENFLSALRAAR